MRALLALLLAVAATSAAPLPHRAVMRDGTILKHKEMALDAEAQVLRWKAREYPLSALYLVEAEDGALVWAPDYDSRLRGYELITR
jgi:hypothetical protein